jgi:hypothetical protein
MKINLEYIFNNVIVLLIAAGIGYLAYNVPVLKSQVDDVGKTQSNLETRTQFLEMMCNIIAGFLEARLNFNVQAFVDIAIKKGITPQQLKVATPIFESNPTNIGSYLQNNFQFTPEEVKEVMTVPK